MTSSAVNGNTLVVIHRREHDFSRINSSVAKHITVQAGCCFLATLAS